MTRFLLNLLLFGVIALAGVIALGLLYPPQSLAPVQSAGAQSSQSKKAPSLPHAALSVLSEPQLSATFINQVLTAYGSPAAGKGQTLYSLGRKYGINSDIALAFFGHESTFGTRGEATITLSLGNLRCIPDRPCIDQDRGGYAQMRSWEDGFEQWYKLIKNLYVGEWGRTTVEQIIPKYAPNSDGNHESGYVQTVKTFLSTWYEGRVQP